MHIFIERKKCRINSKIFLDHLNTSNNNNNNNYNDNFFSFFLNIDIFTLL